MAHSEGRVPPAGRQTELEVRVPPARRSSRSPRSAGPSRSRPWMRARSARAGRLAMRAMSNDAAPAAVDATPRGQCERYSDETYAKMRDDEARTAAYDRAIALHSKGRTVLDIGTGALALLAQIRRRRRRRARRCLAAARFPSSRDQGGRSARRGIGEAAQEQVDTVDAVTRADGQLLRPCPRRAKHVQPSTRHPRGQFVHS